MRNLHEVHGLISGRKLEHGQAPSLSELQKLVSNRDLLKDPWGRDVVYDPRPPAPLLFSAGANGIPGDEDDVGVSPLTRQCPYDDVVFIEVDGRGRIVPITYTMGSHTLPAIASPGDALALGICAVVVMGAVALALTARSR